MIVDSSAFVAIFKGEAAGDPIMQLLKYAKEPIRMSAATYLETTIVLDKRKEPVLSNRFDRLIEELRVVIEPVTFDLAKVARQAYSDFGKGSGHSASLNFGDCFSYALAKESGESLLFVGKDFAQTDLHAVEY